MRHLYLLVLLFFVDQASAQDTTNTSSANNANTSVNVPAMFPEGQEVWKKLLNSRLNPFTPAEMGAGPGVYVVTVSYVIDTTGEVTELKILNDPGYGTAGDVKRAFKNVPKWIPATMNGKKVQYRQKQDFTYQVSQQ